MIAGNAISQSPNKISYQAVIRNAENNLVNDQVVGVQISILQGSVSGTVVYAETHNPTTNANGLMSIEIGSWHNKLMIFQLLTGSMDLTF